MKKFITTAVAACALAAGTAASAQDFGTVISSLFGFGTPAYPSYSYGTPAVVAGAQTVYVDQYGRRFVYDQYGRQVYLTSTQQQIIGYDQWGRPVYGSSSYGYGTYGSYGTPHYPYGTYGSSTYSRSWWDRDGDGVADARDRWPSDSRYW